MIDGHIMASNVPRRLCGAMLVCVGVLFFSGSSHVQAGVVPLPVGAKSIYEDDFNRKELQAYAAGNIDPNAREQMRWTIVAGRWELKLDAKGEGYLLGGGSPGEIFYDKAVGLNFRMEYTAWSTNTGDRSAVMALPLPNYEYKDLYFFQVGGGYSRYNRMYREGKPLVDVDTSLLPVAGVRQRIIVQKQEDLLEMYVDGRCMYSVKDPEYERVRMEAGGPLGVCLGFQVWNMGICFDDVKIYNLPGSQSEALPADAKVEYALWRGFGTQGPQQAPEIVIRNGAVRNAPTVVYRPKPVGQCLTNDYCVELGTQTGRTEQALTSGELDVTFPQALKSGEVELELLSPGYNGECGRVELLDAHENVLGTVIIGKDGTFRAETASGEQPLVDRISYRNRPKNGRFWFQPNRWFSLRLGFNCEAGVFQVGIVNLYSGYATLGIQWFPLGSSLPLAGKGEAVKKVRVKTGPSSVIWVDNVCVASPRAARLNGRIYTESLRSILNLDYPMRADPPSLMVHSLRNEGSTLHPALEIKQAWRKPPTPEFVAASKVYEPLLARQALLDERCQALERMLFHLEQSGSGRVLPMRQLLSSLDKHRKTSFEALDVLYRAYANAWLDNCNEQMLQEGFDPAAGRLTEILDQLEQETETYSAALLKAAGDNFEAGLSLIPGPYDGSLAWKNGRFEREGRPILLYIPWCSGSVGEFRGRLLQLDYCHNIPLAFDDPTKTGRTDTVSFVWPVVDDWISNYLKTPETNSYFSVWSLFGCVHTAGFCPAWWMEKHRDDPDIFFCDDKGALVGKQPIARPVTSGYYAGGGGYQALLNYWNPAVQTMYRQMLEEWSGRMEAKYPGRTKLYLLGLEQSTLAWSTQSGFNESAILAFRKKLKDKYGSIAALNKAWGSDYKEFDEINQRQVDASGPNGLMYEFQVFRQEGYWDWMRLLSASLKKHMPDLAVMNDYHCLLGSGDYQRMLDVPSMFKTYDIVGHHTYAADKESPVISRRILDSLKKAYGNPLGDYEWGAGMHWPDLFYEEGYKLSGLLDMFQEMAWGKSVLSIWYGGAAGFSEGSQYYVPQLCGAVLRYSSCFMPVGRLRARRFGEIALTWPTVTPPVALLEATATQMNGVDVRTIMTEAAKSLERKGWNYGFIWEDVLLEGKQSLNGIQTLILVQGVCLKPETSALLVKWVKQGGALIALLSPGEMNQFGRKDGRLMRELMPGVEYTLDKAFSKVTELKSVPGIQEATKGEMDVRVLRAKAGKGEMVLLTGISPYPEKALLREVDRRTQRDMEAVGGKFWWVARESPDHLYLFVMNPDFYETHTDVIRLKGVFGKAVDLGCDKAFPMPTIVKDGYTTLALRLAPAEGTVIRIERRGKAEARGQKPEIRGQRSEVRCRRAGLEEYLSFFVGGSNYVNYT